ncbi:MAG: hypothetical protein HZC28_12410 [Spirochaetes bacterium]|nr:hypothetical protein [Spirochaetota bacterium]
MKIASVLSAALVFAIIIVSCAKPKTDISRGVFTATGEGANYEAACIEASNALYTGIAKSIALKAVRHDTESIVQYLHASNVIIIKPEHIKSTAGKDKTRVTIFIRDEALGRKINSYTHGLTRDGFTDENTLRASGVGEGSGTGAKYRAREAALMTAKAKMKMLLQRRYPDGTGAVDRLVSLASVVEERYEGNRCEIVIELKIDIKSN